VIQGISDFVRKHNVEDVPCILTGDLNATQFERLLGIASVAALLRRDASVHPFIFDCEDMPSRATTVTTARQMRLDAILHQGKYMDLVEACEVPVLSTSDPIPNDKHPSDHVPIKAIFRLRSKLEITQHSGREWYLRLAGRGSFHALTLQELRDAFTLYDHSGSGCITARRVREAIASVMGTGVASPEEMDRVVEKLPRGGMDLPTFIDVFKKATLEMGMPGMEDVKATFIFFDKNQNGSLELDEMRAMFRESSPVAVPDDEIEKLFRQINTHCDGQISMEEYVKHISTVWVSRFSS
jgi:Ca2+-binding EF-hand superfamily protein